MFILRFALGIGILTNSVMLITYAMLIKESFERDKHSDASLLGETLMVIIFTLNIILMGGSLYVI
ncbi:MAG: hypothetical protein ACRCR2_08055 [Fusobacteriaceae bacterium]